MIPNNTGNVREVGTKIASDQFMVEPARSIARLVAGAGLPAYEFRFSYVAESMRKQWKGAPHATEIPFVFDTVAARYGKDLAPKDKATARQPTHTGLISPRRATPIVLGCLNGLRIPSRGTFYWISRRAVRSLGPMPGRAGWI